MTKSAKAAKPVLTEATPLEKEKSKRQEQSRASVNSGAKSLDDNFFIKRENARKLTYKFKE